MVEKITPLINAAFGFSLASLAAASSAYVFRRRLFGRPDLWLAAAWLALTAALALMWAALGRPPLSNQYESVLTLLWFIFPFAFYYRKVSGRQEAVPAAAAAAALLFGAAALLDRTARPLMPALRSDWLIFHVLSSMAAYAAFALCAAAAVWALAKKKSAELDEFLLRLTRVGFAFLTLGIATGSVWAETAWGSWWSWDPKETWSLLTWLGYAAALHLRRKGAVKEKFAIISLLCFALVLFTYFGVNFLLAGMHSYG